VRRVTFISCLYINGLHNLSKSEFSLNLHKQQFVNCLFITSMCWPALQFQPQVQSGIQRCGSKVLNDLKVQPPFEYITLKLH
jgi:hypothetical protein